MFYLNFLTMKRVFFISMMALACMVCTTSCSDDENGGDAALTGITVTPPSFKGAVGAVQKLTATAVPAGAPLGTLTWASSAASVATVDQSGVVTIAGVGTAEVTVTSGTISQKVSIEGTIKGLTVTDVDGNSVGTYPYNGTPINFTLTVTPDPDNATVVPTWTSGAANATVVAASNGLTAEVTISGEGTAIITVAVGDVTATYTISTSSVFESAAGYWTFNDPADLGKATRGEDLRFEADWIQVIDGPSATKKAVYVKENPALEAPNYGNCPDVTDGYGFFWDHTMAGTGAVTYSGWTESAPLGNIVGQFTFLIDVRVPVEPNNYHYPTFLTPNDYIFHYGLDLRPDNGNLVICSNWGTRGAVAVDMVAGQEPWVRVVIKCDLTRVIEEGLTTDGWGRGDISVYSNGINVYEGTGETSLGFASIVEGQPLKFLGGMPEGQNFNYSVSTIALWDRLLTDDEIASLGGVSK
jgi:hypothetical protein